MSLFSFFKNQLIEVIEWTNDDHSKIVYRFPVHNHQIKMGAQLTVRESQMALFINEGQIADAIGPGRYELSTENLPVLTSLKSWKHGFNSPFKAEVYFVNMHQFTNQKWGTRNPIMLRDSEFGVVRLRCFGNFAFRVIDPVTFLREIFGTKKEFTTEGITEHLRTVLISGLTDLIAESKIAAIDLALHYDEISSQARDKLQTHFQQIGLELSSLFIENISLPKAVEQAIDKRASMGALGNLNRYTQYQTAEAIRDAANNPGGGGLAGIGANMGAGMAIGQMMTGANQQQAQNAPETPSAPPAAAEKQKGSTTPCTKCSSPLKPDHKFCPECGTPAASTKFCQDCGKEIKISAKFCPECGSKQS